MKAGKIEKVGTSSEILEKEILNKECCKLNKNCQRKGGKHMEDKETQIDKELLS